MSGLRAETLVHRSQRIQSALSPTSSETFDAWTKKLPVAPGLNTARSAGSQPSYIVAFEPCLQFHALRQFRDNL